MLPIQFWLFAATPWLMASLWHTALTAPRPSAEIIPFPARRVRRLA